MSRNGIYGLLSRIPRARVILKDLEYAAAHNEGGGREVIRCGGMVPIDVNEPVPSQLSTESQVFDLILETT
ncbi:hypothetical protein PG994_009032 [Apiospora phragmitis]|uniref:Uncharacterized protein n=1 Tax=Apiospora phragmitis TaxID=2905665 RepID=A0ABR1UI51_9PEZI